MKKPMFLKPLICALSLFLPCGARAAATVDELIKQGNVYDLKFNPQEALNSYLPAEKLEPNNVDLLLRIARQYRHQMADTGSVAEKIRFSGMGLDYARRAVALAPKNSEANLSIAIGYAKSLEFYSSKEKMNALHHVKDFTDKAIALDSSNDVAWYILGRWHEKVADLNSLKRKVAEIAYGRLPKATNDDAAKCFRKAISLNPNRSAYYVDLGITCAAMDNQADARKFIEKGLALPNAGKDDPETKKRGKETLLALR
jgi:cytochrome c-type biogenesis protein CcmH/NrfG